MGGSWYYTDRVNFDPNLSNHPVILFDGLCNLCNRSVQAVIQRDPEAIFRFAGLQSEFGQQIIQEFNLADQHVDSVVFVYEKKIYVKSDAILQIIKLMGGLTQGLVILGIIPRSIRDGIYDWVALNRYGWFGKQEFCMVPTPDLADRLLT